MKSLCIKTNNTKSIDYLLSSLENLDIGDTYFSCKVFKHYTNIIVHYLGIDYDNFIGSISDLLTCLIFDEFESLSLDKEIKIPPVSNNPNKELKEIINKEWEKESKNIPKERPNVNCSTLYTKSTKSFV